MSEEILAINVRLPPDERDALDSWRRQQIDPPTRARAARELIRQALAERESGAAGQAA